MHLARSCKLGQRVQVIKLKRRSRTSPCDSQVRAAHWTVLWKLEPQLKLNAHCCKPWIVVAAGHGMCIAGKHSLLMLLGMVCVIFESARMLVLEPQQRGT